MKGFEDAEIEQFRGMIDEALAFMGQRRMLEARRKLNTLGILLQNAKEVPINPDIELGKDVSLSGGDHAIKPSATGSLGPTSKEA